MQSEVEALLCLSLDSRQDVDAIVEKAVLAGGKADPGPKQDHGFMYGRSFEETELGQSPSSRRAGRFDDEQHASIAWASRAALRRRLTEKIDVQDHPLSLVRPHGRGSRELLCVAAT
jgi:hypothetical protein